MKTLPFQLPAAYKLKPGQSAPVADVDTGGYDVLIGGIGFRLATDTQFPYLRSTEPTTVRRFDNSAEVGEQTLSPLPWLKSQSTFEGGAGQKNIEGPYVAFQYQQEQIAHMRFDSSLGVDVWTPGQVTRLPDCTYTAFGHNISAMVTAVVNGVDVAVIGGAQSLYQVTWSSGPDAAPAISPIDLSSATFGGMSNCTISSLTTDGRNYYGLLQLTAVGSTPNVLTYVISGQMESASAPVVLYEVPNNTGLLSRTNLCTNPSFETNLTSWTAAGAVVPTLAQVTSPAPPTGGRSKAMSITYTGTGTAGQFNGVAYTLATTNGATYTVSCQVYVPVGAPAQAIVIAGGGISSSSSVNGAWQQISYTFTATGSSTQITVFGNAAQTAGQVVYLDEVLIEKTGSVGSYFDGSTTTDSNYSYSWTGTADGSTSTASPVNGARNAYGVCGWVKERLIAAVANSVYELNATAPQHSALPTAKFIHPISAYQYAAISESPDSILIAGQAGNQATILRFKLDTTGATPVLGGGATIASLPIGESVKVMAAYLGSFIAIGTTKGIRVGTFDTYTGNFTYGPLSVTTTAPVYGIAGYDRFVFGSYTNQQQDGKTGLVRVDLTQPIDQSGRLAWAADIRPPSSAPTGQGTVYGVGVLPQSGRVVFVTQEGVHVQGGAPGSDGTAWLKTSRIRYDTNEKKLFKTLRINGALDVASIGITAVGQFGQSWALGTFGFLANASDPGDIAVPVGLQPYLQLQFSLTGSQAVFNNYSLKAYPAPTRQRVITLTVNCFRQEVDRYGLEVTDPLLPRDRYNAVRALESTGKELRFVEFTNLGAVAELVVIDQIEYHSFSRPNIDDDFGGYITFKLRSTSTT